MEQTPRVGENSDSWWASGSAKIIREHERRCSSRIVSWLNLPKMDEVMSTFLPEFVSQLENIKKNFYGMVHFSSKLGGHFCETGKYLATKKLDLHPRCGL